MRVVECDCNRSESIGMGVLALSLTAIVYLPDGRKYLLAVQVERPFNDYTARDIIQMASKIIYDHEIQKQGPDLLVASPTETE